MASAGASSAAVRRAALDELADKLRDSTFPDRLLAEEPQSVVVVDVRSPEERAVSVIPGASVVAAGEYETDPARWAGRQVVCHCTAGYRSGTFARKLLAAAGAPAAASAGALASGGGDAAAVRTEVFNLRGGILGWTHEGLPLVEPGSGKETRRVHVYAQRWALQADGYEPLTFKRPFLTMAKDVFASLFKR